MFKISRLAGAAISAISILAGLGAFLTLAPRTSAFGMLGMPDQAKALRLGLTFGATLGGVVIGSVYRQLRELQKSGPTIERPLVFLLNVSRSIDLWLGVIGSPIVYALVLQSTTGMSLPGLLLVALENGFCCLLIVNAFVGRTETSLSKNPRDPKSGGTPEVRTPRAD